jgi:hypothetical protein
MYIFLLKEKFMALVHLLILMEQCKFLNYPNANLPTVQNYDDIQENYY